MPVTRDLKKEQQAVGQYQGIYKRMPDINNPQDRANLYKLAYSPQSGLPAELAGSVDESLYSAGISAPNQLSQTVAGSNLGQLSKNVATAQKQVENTSQPNEALRVLQEAIRTKSGMANQPIGESELFKEAGVTGYGALSSSLAAQGNKLDMDFSNFQNIVGQMSGTYKDMANTALKSYEMAYRSYKDETDRLQSIENDLNDHKQAIELQNLQYQNSIKLKEYEARHPGVSDIVAGNAAGLKQDANGDWVSADAGQITSSSGHTYDMSTYNAPGGQAYIESLQQSINRVGKLNNMNELQNYININMPKSLITAEDIRDVADEQGIGWEEILGLIQKESPGGASNVALKNNNFGGITWSPSYQASHPNVSKGTARPAAEGGYYVKFNSVRDGLTAQAEQLAKRQIVSSPSSNATEANLDQTSKSILNATGLSMPAFMFMTQGTSALTRMTAPQRLQYMKEAESYANRTGTDVATFQSQYQALGKTVEANSLRNNQAAVAESELNATIENIKTAATEADFKKLRGLNVADIFAGKETNNPAVAKYMFHLQQLRSEFAMYNAAIAGQIDSNGNIREISDGDRSVADGIIKDGFAAGSIDGFAKALEASRSKMQTVLQNSIATQNKAVWKLFGVENKYNAANESSSSSNNDPLGIR